MCYKKPKHLPPAQVLLFVPSFCQAWWQKCTLAAFPFEGRFLKNWNKDMNLRGKFFLIYLLGDNKFEGALG